MNARSVSAELDDLFNHLEWADATLFTAAFATRGAEDDHRIRDLLIHIHEVQWAYLQLWRGETLSIPTRASFADLRAVCGWAREYHTERASFLASVGPNALDAEIAFPWAERLAARFGTVHPTSLRQSMLQIALHSAYHRGQVNTRIREIGGEPPLLDFVAWVWAGEPSAAWP